MKGLRQGICGKKGNQSRLGKKKRCHVVPEKERQRAEADPERQTQKARITAGDPGSPALGLQKGSDRD
jgi:hypothetical protein